MATSPIPTTPLLTGAAADRRLDQITGVTSSRHEIFLPTLRAAHHGSNVPGRLAPPSARGLRAWTDGTEELRVRMEPFRWQVPDQAALDSAGIVVSQDGKTAIAMVAGDPSTGRSNYRPQVKHARGPVAAEYVQGSFFSGFDQDEAFPELWYLLHEMKSEFWHAELSLPAAISKAGLVTRWKDRIQIVANGPDDGLPVEADASPELPTPTVRWRESA